MRTTSETMAGGCVALSTLLLVLAAAVGWVLNIAKIVGTINDPLTAMLLLRVFGVPFFPLGCVLGWF